MKYSSNNDKNYTYKDYPDVLINKYNITDKQVLIKIEEEIILAKLSEEENIPEGRYDLKHLQNIHRYLFGELYEWAGKIRDVNITKGNSTFCSSQFIETEYDKLHKNIELCNLSKLTKENQLKKLAYFHGEVNMIHPFREGNGRATRTLIKQMAQKECKIFLNYNKVTKEVLIEACKEAILFDYTKMEKVYEEIAQNIKKDKIANNILI